MKKTKDTIPFEQALQQLESLVAAMETGDIPLADLLAKFEEGTSLLKICESRLKEAELKIETLTQHPDTNNTGTPTNSEISN